MTGTDLALLIVRLFMGGFFLLAAYRKTLGDLPEQWNALRERLGLAPWWTVFVPAAQFLGGLGLVFGALTQWAAAGLFVILLGGFVLDAWKPFCDRNRNNTRAGWAYEWCENYHVLMLLALLALILAGGGGLSLDALAGRFL